MERFPGHPFKSKLAKCQRLSIVWTLPTGNEGFFFFNFYNVVQISDTQQGKSAMIKQTSPPSLFSLPSPPPSLQVIL